MAGEETNHKNEEIERGDITDRLAQLSSSLFDGIENVDALIEQANSPENASIFEQMLINVSDSPDFTTNERNAEVVAMQILLHLQGHGATVKDIDGFRGTNTNNALRVWHREHGLLEHYSYTSVLHKLALFNRQERFAKAMGIEDDTMLASNATEKLMEDASVTKAKEHLQKKLEADTGGNLTLGKEISAMALAVQILLKQAGNNPQGLDGHVGGKTLAAAKAFAEEYDESAEEANKINWNGGWPIPNELLKRLAGITDAPQPLVIQSSETTNIAARDSSAGPVVLRPVDRTAGVAVARAESTEVFIAGGTTEVTAANLNEALTAASTELAKENANKSWVEALLNAIFGLDSSNLSANQSQSAAGMLEDLVNDEQPVESVGLRANSLNHLANYNLREYQRLNDNTATAGQAATHASSALRYANQTLELTAAAAAADAESMTENEISQLETSARNILAHLSSVPHFGPGEVQNMFDTVTTLDVDLDDAHIDGAGILEDYIDGSDVKYEELQEALLGRFGLGANALEWSDGYIDADLFQQRKLEYMKEWAVTHATSSFAQYERNESVNNLHATMAESANIDGYIANETTDDEINNIASAINNLESIDDLQEYFKKAHVSIEAAEQYGAEKAFMSIFEEGTRGVMDSLPPEALDHPSAFDAESTEGFENLVLFFTQQEILDPHQSAREFFALLQEKVSMDGVAHDWAFLSTLHYFTNQNPAAAAALMKAESYEDLFGAPPTEDAVTPAEPRQPEEIGGSPADHQKYINKARGHALKQLRLTRNVVDDFVTGMFDGVSGDVNDKAEDAFTAMIARLEDTENHPNYVLDIPFGASIDAVAKPEDPQNAAILENWEQEKPILGIRVSSEFDTNQFGSKLMGAIHGTEILTDWDFGVDNISGTNEYLISVKTDGKLHTALQESGANPATWELALREILRAGMQHTQIEGEFFNPRTAHRRGMEAFEQQEKNEEMEQLRISERFLRNHEARASSLEINGETISTFAIERQVEGETYYVHVAEGGGGGLQAMPGAFSEENQVFIERVNQDGSRSIVYEKREIQKVLQLRSGAESSIQGLVAMSRFEDSGQEVMQYSGDDLRINNEDIPTIKYTYQEGETTYLLHIANATRTSDHQSARINPAAGFSDSDQYQVFLTRQSPESGGHDHVLPLITDALLIERATRAVEEHLSGEAEAEEERTADFLDLFHHHSSQYEKAKEPDPTDGTATEFQHAIFEEINTSFAEIDGTDYFVLDLSHENTPTDVRVHLSGAFQAENKLYVPITGNKIPPAVVVTEDLPGGYKHEFLAIGDGKRPQEVENKYINEIISPLDAVFNPIPKLQTAPLVRHVHIAGQTAPDRVEASSAE